MAYVIGEQVKTKDGKVGKLLGVIAGVAHIGVEGGITTARASDLVRAPGEATTKLPEKPVEKKPDPPVQVIELSDKVMVEDDLTIVTDVPVKEEPKEIDFGMPKIIPNPPKQEESRKVSMAPEALTKEWLSETPIPELKKTLDEDITLSKPRKAKIRKAIRSRL